MSRPLRPFAAALVSLTVVIVLTAAGRGQIRQLTLDPEAPVVGLFEAIDSGAVTAFVAPKDAYSSNLFFTNQTNKPITLELPKALTAVHVLPQGLFQQGNLFANGPQQTGANQGQGQTVGGGITPVGQQQFPNNPLNNPLQANNFFSIPPERTVQLQLKSVCLEYGKPEPAQRMNYVLRRLEDQIPDPTLRQLLENFSPERTDRAALQAAAWHLAQGYSWEELAKKQRQYAPGIARPLFTAGQLGKARDLVATAQKQAGERPDARQADVARR